MAAYGKLSSRLENGESGVAWCWPTEVPGGASFVNGSATDLRDCIFDVTYLFFFLAMFVMFPILAASFRFSVMVHVSFM